MEKSDWTKMMDEHSSIKCQPLLDQIKELEEDVSFFKTTKQQLAESADFKINKMQESIDKLIKALEEINNTCGTINLSSFNQTIEGVKCAVEISNEAIEDYNKLNK